MVGSVRKIILVILFLLVFSPLIEASSPFTGLALPRDSRKVPVMAIIDNFVPGNTQSGLDKASIVYEFPVEGGITRLMALFYEDIPTRIGPIRSAREYMVQKAREYNAVMLHAGASPGGYEAINRMSINNLDDFFHSDYFYRDNSLRAPHNLFSGWPYLRDFLATHNYTPPASRFPFSSITITSLTEPEAKNVRIRFSANNIVEYRYLPWEGYYQRYVNGSPHVLENGAPIKVDNLVIQFVRTQILDEEGRLGVDLEGSGPLLVFQDGQVIEGTWLKVGPGWTSFLDDRGRLINFNAGKTWVEIVPRGQEVSY